MAYAASAPQPAYGYGAPAAPGYGGAAPGYGAAPYGGAAAPGYGGAVVVMPPTPGGAGDPETGKEWPGHTAPGYSERMEKVVRMGFIRKVYGILTVQLAVTFAIVCAFVFVDSVRAAVQHSPGILYAAIGVSFVTLIALTCCPGVAKSYPGNYIALSVFTLAEAYLLGAIASFYSTHAVAWALGALVIVVVGLTLFAWQTKIDFTMLSGSLFIILLAFMLFGIWAAIFRDQVTQTIYATLGVIVFGIFLVYDTQLVLGGKHRSVSFGTDDYIFAALNLYLDIVQLFLYLLRLFGNNRD